MESTLNPSGALEVFGPLARPARKSRRQSTGTVSSQGILSQDQVVSSDTSAAMQSIPGVYTRGAVEELSDAELVELVLTGTQEAFEVLVERYKDAVQNLAYRMLSNVTEAEDVTQEVFVRAYTQLSTYKPAHKFSTWLLSIASHLAIDQLRRRRFLALPLEDVPFLEWITDLGAGPEQSALEGEQHDEIQAYLQKLPSKYRAVIVLRYWYDLSYEEIAMALNLTPALVKARLHRARELLARYIQENKENEEEQSDALPRR
ncbi:MAG TPA: sigma-70 family RNA polymerase sigma factor [Ktedonobacteraceae bacterium]|jgi:RNA polymerase sigma factor (sigma-70 family)|nr:sigma-70 family RNA polymerase sigma factor [Ktedonobacteraceae bacterium]